MERRLEHFINKKELRMREDMKAIKIREVKMKFLEAKTKVSDDRKEMDS